MAYKSLPYVSAFALLSGAAAIASCSSHPSATGAGAGASSSSSGAGTGGVPSQFQADAPAVYVAKVKNLLVGLAPTDAEIQMVTADPSSLKTLVNTWMTDPTTASLYQAKMQVFFSLAFQQTQINSASFIDMVLPNGLGPGEGVPLLVQNVSESFARTMQALIAQGQPLTAAMTTKSYMMTPPLMEFYAWLDEYHADDETKTTDKLATDYPTLKNIVQGTKTAMGQSLQNVTLQQMADPTSAYFLNFYNPDVPNLMYPVGDTACDGIDPILYPVNSSHIHWLMYGAVDNHKNPNNMNCGSRSTGAGTMIWSQADFAESAWRMVTIRPPMQGEQTTRFFDVAKLRGANELVINTPRVGYFSTPAFFANWSTNSSNQMRVTLNQALIVALGIGIDGTDSTNAPNAPGSMLPPALDDAHAPPGPCFFCHQLLDPTRAILSATWTYPYYTQLDAGQIAQKGEFAFQGVINTNIKTIDDFANTLATHPLFPAAWVQKLCYYANSQPCDASDPEFERIVGVFKSSNFSWTALVQEVFSSPLTTNAVRTQTTNASEIVAVSRRDHLCAALNNRLGLVDVCGLQVNAPKTTITTIVPGLPSDGYGRGAPAPVLPNQPTLFYRAGLENICGAVAAIVIDNKTPPTPAPSHTWTSSMDSTSAVADFVSILMAIEPSDPRSAPAQAALNAHFAAAIAAGAKTTAALQSTFTVACMAPSAIGIGM